MQYATKNKRQISTRLTFSHIINPHIATDYTCASNVWPAVTKITK